MLSIFRKIIGDLVQAQYFPDFTWAVSFAGNQLGLAHFIALGVIVRIGVQHSRHQTVWCGSPTLVARTCSSRWWCSSSSPISAAIGTPTTCTLRFPGLGGRHAGHGHIFIAGWSAHGTEVCAIFAPEYKGKRDMHIALRNSAMFMLMVCALCRSTRAGSPAREPEGRRGPVLRNRVSDHRRPHRRRHHHGLHHRQPGPVDGASTADAARALYGSRAPA